MKFNILDVVVLNRDEPSYRLKSGDLGTVVESYERGAVEVEFVTAAGTTQTVATLDPSALRRVSRNDLLAVRPVTGAA